MQQLRFAKRNNRCRAPYERAENNGLYAHRRRWAVSNHHQARHPCRPILSLRWRQRLAHLVALALIPITFFGYQSLSAPGVVVPMTLGIALVVWLLPEPWSVR